MPVPVGTFRVMVKTASEAEVQEDHTEQSDLVSDCMDEYAVGVAVHDAERQELSGAEMEAVQKCPGSGQTVWDASAE